MVPRCLGRCSRALMNPEWCPWLSRTQDGARRCQGTARCTCMRLGQCPRTSRNPGLCPWSPAAVSTRRQITTVTTPTSRKLLSVRLQPYQCSDTDRRRVNHGSVHWRTRIRRSLSVRRFPGADDESNVVYSELMIHRRRAKNTDQLYSNDRTRHEIGCALRGLNTKFSKADRPAR